MNGDVNGWHGAKKGKSDFYIIDKTPFTTSFSLVVTEFREDRFWEETRPRLPDLILETRPRSRNLKLCQMQCRAGLSHAELSNSNFWYCSTRKQSVGAQWSSCSRNEKGRKTTCNPTIETRSVNSLGVGHNQHHQRNKHGETTTNTTGKQDKSFLFTKH